ncbi:1-(5-phosphoribosyl)-5-[(5-phosphoribosylamino)methylideneamino]imidazole-4-carboxamide isomerase [Ornithinibacillus californiensis]|uniref:1-(5-phosphoribosyl)-5-[(5- phosphoribosylamino)methylideneamino]imidazole-4- carboxamide isomerase n=1 Tax=Ornithinibacillus californiensis TaxID=161536 RepID=UPI00064DB123|nr:1-(5-phosphoribosyl)-5-[(5-phosphoribosylamino)methylideneamino]imidazole-4-carboxamide isomerase [Ornithinibacillus californiensis]
MILFPAIDILNEKCVRLIQGDYAKEKIYSNSPLAMADRWISLGATALHIVDLDGAKTGNATNQTIIEQITSNTNVPIQVGGGIRSMEQIENYLSIGVQRVILGTAAVHNISLLNQAVDIFKDKVAVSIDARDGFVATDGWRQTSNVLAVDLVKQLEQIGVQTIIYTDISKDGMLQGPNFQELENLQHASSVRVIASGGISSNDDVKKLSDMNLYGAIIGKALYDNSVDFTELLEVTRNVS